MGSFWISWTSYLDLAVEAALIATLLRNGLFRVYPIFFSYLTADAVETALGLAFQANRALYAWIYLTGQAAKIVLALFVVLELSQIALDRHPALAQFMQRALAYLLVGTAGVAALAVRLDSNIPAGRSRVIHRFNTFERTMDLWMLGFLLMTTVFIMWFPVRMKRNGAMYIGGFVIYFVSRSAGLLFRNLEPGWRQPIDNALAVASILCLTMWLFALTRRGEEVTTVLGHRWSLAETERLTAQLNEINVKLMELSRK
jgi:hypothetical protein